MSDTTRGLVERLEEVAAWAEQRAADGMPHTASMLREDADTLREAAAALSAAEARAERYRVALEQIERVAKRNEARIGGGTDSEWLVRVASAALTEGERDG